MNHSKAHGLEEIVLVFADASTEITTHPYSQDVLADALPELNVQVVFQLLQRFDAWCDCAA